MPRLRVPPLAPPPARPAADARSATLTPAVVLVLRGGWQLAEDIRDERQVELFFVPESQERGGENQASEEKKKKEQAVRTAVFVLASPRPLGHGRVVLRNRDATTTHARRIPHTPLYSTARDDSGTRVVEWSGCVGSCDCERVELGGEEGHGWRAVAEATALWLCRSLGWQRLWTRATSSGGFASRVWGSGRNS